jgi:hypothetical protein
MLKLSSLHYHSVIEKPVFSQIVDVSNNDNYGNRRALRYPVHLIRRTSNIEAVL